MKAVSFHTLQRAIQDRFVGSVMSGFPPAPLLAVKGAASTKVVWLGISGGCFVVAIIVARLGYGSLDSGMSMQSWWVIFVYAALIFGMAFGLVQAWTRLVRERALPYTAGVYLFPACLIDARSDSFKVYETKDLASVNVQGGAIRVSFAGGASYLFPVANPGDAPQIANDVNVARDRALHAKATEDPKELVSVDPLHNPRFSSPVGPRDPYDVRRPPWGKMGWAVALGFAALLGPLLYWQRNSGSDKNMYARAIEANDIASYNAYLSHGSAHKDEIASTLLPRAELREAVKVGTVEALLAFKASHPNTKIDAELNASIRAAMLAELEKAKVPGTLAALGDFAKKYPDHGVQPELDQAMHAVYVRELEAYKKRAPQKNKDVVPFVERLFAWAEKHGPKVEVRFRRRKGESLGRADQTVSKTPNFGGEVSYPSRYFDDKHAQKREAALAKAIATKLDAGFSPELLSVDVGAPVPDGDALPDVKVPTLFVTDGAEWLGTAYPSTKPRGTYVGMSFPFDSVFVIPADPKPLKLYKGDIMKQTPPLGVLKEDDPPLGPGAAEEKVYETMATGAFDTFSDRLLSQFFKVDK